MLKLLNIPTTNSPHITTPINWINISKYLDINVERSVSYYNRFGSFVNAEHVLVRFLTGLPVSIQLDNWSYYSAIKNLVISKSTVYGMTSSQSVGYIHSGNFYGDDKEIIIAINGEYNPDFVEKNWTKMRPVKILRHDYDDFDYQLIRGRKKNSLGGISVILVDLTLLALQYKFFRNAEILKSKITGAEQRSIMFYMAAHPLNTAMYSHIDQVVLNRYHKILDDGLITLNGYSKIHFVVNNINSLINLMVKDSINRLTKNSKNIFECLSSVFLNDAKNAAKWIVLPETLLNRQCLWAYIYSKISTIKLGLLLGGKHTKERNSAWIPNFIRLYQRIMSDSIISQPNLKYIKKDLENELNEIMDIIKI